MRDSNSVPIVVSSALRRFAGIAAGGLLALTESGECVRPKLAMLRSQRIFVQCVALRLRFRMLTGRNSASGRKTLSRESFEGTPRSGRQWGAARKTYWGPLA